MTKRRPLRPRSPAGLAAFLALALAPAPLTSTSPPVTEPAPIPAN